MPSRTICSSQEKHKVENEKSSSWGANEKMQRDKSLALARARALIISSANLIPGHKASLRLNKDGKPQIQSSPGGTEILNNISSQPAMLPSNLLAGPDNRTQTQLVEAKKRLMHGITKADQQLLSLFY